MKKILTAIKLFINDPLQFLGQLLIAVSSRIENDKTYLLILFRLKMGYTLDLRNPRTFQEKIQWLKLFDRKPQYTDLVDKYEVKQIISRKIGVQYIIPTLGVWNTPDDIDWDRLPDKFVLKTTHDGGGCGIVICRDKKSFNKMNAIKQLKLSLNRSSYHEYREWPYRDVKKRVLAEQYLEFNSTNNSQDIPDYKFFCFNGKPLYCQVIRDRYSLETIDFFDMEWNHMPFVGLNSVYDINNKSIITNGLEPVTKPESLSKMIEICKQLSAGIPFVRVDLYYLKERVFFGELTFYPSGGFSVFLPDEWNHKFGELIDLPKV